MKNLKTIAIFFMLGLCLSCSELASKVGLNDTTTELSIPADEATPAERTTIETVRQEISLKAADFGISNSFSSLPILVTSENSEVTGRMGYCVWDSSHQGHAIVLNRTLFQQDLADPRLQRVFATLLHEIGHCYFAREHEHSRIDKPGYILSVEVTDSTGGIQLSEPGFPVSSMYVGTNNKCANCEEYSSGFPAVPEFKDYYISEILNKDRVQNLQDLERFHSLRWHQSGK